MLQSLSIKNLALIKNENIEFSDGLNIILGETGAGKSLIFEALFFVLGLKTDKSLLRTGEENMKVEVLFSNFSPTIKQSIENLGIELEDELLISRSLNIDGRSSLKINGSLATLLTLKNLSSILVDTLVQHQGLELLKTKNHLSMLDSFIGTQISQQKQQLGDILYQISNINKKIDMLGGDSEERERRKEILLFQIEEIERAELSVGEDEEIGERLKLLSSAEKIKENLSLITSLLSNDDGAVSKISEAHRLLNSLNDIEKISVLQDRINSTKYELEDIYEELYDIYSSSNFDEIEFNRLDTRKDLIKSLKKKYGSSIELILEYHDKIKNQYDEITGGEITINKLLKEKTELEEKAKIITSKITEIRKNNAKLVEKAMVSELKDLGMKNTIFEISITPKTLTFDGADEVVFNFSANVGQEVKNIAKTASGGEISRIMLGMKNIFTNDNQNKTFLFDEIDAGISGETGNMVANKLRNISHSEQIICITHLPQVASAGYSFIKVEKNTIDGQTISNATVLEENDVVNEIASLTNGKSPSVSAIKTAQEMRNRYLKNE